MKNIIMMYTFDPKTREFTGSRQAQIVNGKMLTKSSYATSTPPPKNIPEGFTSRWNGSSWETVEDNRQHMDSDGTYTGGTPYWMPEDTWQSQARYMKELGPLPEGATMVKPKKSEKEKQFEAYQKELAEKKAWLASKDYVGTKISTGRATVEEYADVIAQMTEYAARVEELRALIAELESK